MDEEYFASVPLNNHSVLCVGSITRTEADAAREAGLPVNGNGYYLFLASAADIKKPIEILATFASDHAATKLGRLFQRQVV